MPEFRSYPAPTEFSLDLAESVVLYRQSEDQLYDFRFLGPGCVFPVFIGLIAVDVSSARLSTHLRLADLPAVHVPQQLPPEVLRQDTFEIQHQDRVVLAEIHAAGIDHEQRVRGF